MAKKPRKYPEFRYLAANVVRLRRDQGLSQAELAERAEMDITGLSNVERAIVNVALGTVLDLARALKVDACELLQPARFVKAKAGRPRKP